MTEVGQAAPKDAGVVGLEGCELVAMHWEPPSLCCAELAFGRRLRIGQTHMFSYETSMSYTTAPEPEYRRALSQPLEQMVLRVGFTLPVMTPARVWHCSWPTASDAPVDHKLLQLTADGSAHAVHLRPPPSPQWHPRLALGVAARVAERKLQDCTRKAPP